MLQECRCSECNKLLGKIEGRAEIVCTRCRSLNNFNTAGREILRYPPWYNEQWKQIRKKLEAAVAVNCSECKELRYDGKTTRCMAYDDAIIPSVDEKHCKESVQ